MSDVLQFGRPEEAGVRPEWVEDYVMELNRRGGLLEAIPQGLAPPDVFREQKLRQRRRWHAD